MTTTNRKHYILPDYEIGFLEKLVEEEGGIEPTAKLLRATPEALAAALVKAPIPDRSLPLGGTFLVPDEIAATGPESYRSLHISRNMLCAIMGVVGPRPTRYPRECDIGFSACLYELVHPFPLATVLSVQRAVCGVSDWRWAPSCADVTPELWLELLRAHDAVNRRNLRRGMKDAALSRATRAVMARREEIEAPAHARMDRVIAAFNKDMDARFASMARNTLAAEMTA